MLGNKVILLGNKVILLGDKVISLGNKYNKVTLLEKVDRYSQASPEG